MINYGFTKELNVSFSQAVEKATAELKEEGFGVLTKIDLKEKFKEKLDVDISNYVILGACNPASAHKAVQAEENIGLMLPCNVIVYERGDKVVLSVIKPTVGMAAVRNDALKKIAETVEGQLKKVFDSL